MFVDTGFKLHGVPKVIISDHDTHFTGKFWESHFDLLCTDLRFSIAYHLQIDGQSERMIQMLENFLRPYIENKAQMWSRQLALAEFAMNNAVNVATRHIPSFLQSGDHPIAPSVLMHGGGCSNRVEAVQVMVDWMKTALEEAQANLTIAQNLVKAYVDKS